MNENKIQVVSLFSGCGGLDWGFKHSGFNIIWANDNLTEACASYEKNIGSHIMKDDINNIDVTSIPRADLIIGGPPCQGFSGIGKRDPDDARSKLVWTYLDIIKTIKPKIFLFENVTGLKSAMTKNKTRVIDELTKAFRNLDGGYTIRVYSLNAADYGVPQRRERLFIIGNSLGYDIPSPPTTHEMEGRNKPKWISSYQALSDLPSPTNDGLVKSYLKKPDNWFSSIMRQRTDSTTLHITPYASKKDLEIIQYVKPGGNYLDVPDSVATARILYFKSTGGRTTTYGRLDPDMPGYTLNTYFDRPNIGCNIHYKEDRMITIREGMRLQSFSDGYTLFSESRRKYYVQVGNAVPPLLGMAWAKHLKKILSKSTSQR